MKKKLFSCPCLPLFFTRRTRNILLHGPVLLLVFFAVLSLHYDQRFELTLHEGKEVDVQPIFINNGFPLMQPTSITLIRFDHVPGSEEETKQTYTSFLLLKGKEIALSVNKPLRLERFQLYQMDWRFFPRSVLFTTSEKNDEITLEAMTKKGTTLHDGSTLFVVPEKILQDGILYFWQQLDESGKVLTKGYCTSSEAKARIQLPLSGKEDFYLHLLEEDYGYTTILQATWKPFQLPLFFSGILFLLAQLCVYFPQALQSLRKEEL